MTIGRLWECATTSRETFQGAGMECTLASMNGRNKRRALQARQDPSCFVCISAVASLAGRTLGVLGVYVRVLHAISKERVKFGDFLLRCVGNEHVPRSSSGPATYILLYVSLMQPTNPLRTVETIGYRWYSLLLLALFFFLFFFSIVLHF